MNEQDILKAQASGRAKGARWALGCLEPWQLAAAGEDTLWTPWDSFWDTLPARGSLVAGQRGPAVPHATFSLAGLGHVGWKACEERAQERVCTRAKYDQNQPNPLNPHFLESCRKSEHVEACLKQVWRVSPIKPWFKLLVCRHAFPACLHSPPSRHLGQTPVKTPPNFNSNHHGWRDRVHQAEGGRTGLERDPLQGQADNPDGQAEEVLQREGRCPGDQPPVSVYLFENHSNLVFYSVLHIVICFRAQVPVWRTSDQRRRDPEGPGDGAGRCDRGVPGADRRDAGLSSHGAARKYQCQ